MICAFLQYLALSLHRVLPSGTVGLMINLHACTPGRPESEFVYVYVYMIMIARSLS